MVKSETSRFPNDGNTQLSYLEGVVELLLEH